ncbi:MAG TPA: sulfotransferase domain-containing protein [Acidimicrobiales bacterium]|nr:sulfotransferase domain-containing protein [Acidimicrobiales bacterium]
MAEPRRYRNLIMDSQRWEGFQFRDDDIVISTASKCGTTWMQMQCALLLFQDPVLPAPLTRLSPWVDIQTETRESVMWVLEAQTHRRFIKTHTPLDGIPWDDRVTYITVGRDPRDVALSWDNHMGNLNIEKVLNQRIEVAGADDLEELLTPEMLAPPEDPIVRFWTWIENGSIDDPDISGLPSLINHLQTFWVKRDLPNVALFRYEDMKADLDASMRRLASLLGVEVDEAKWPTLVEAATFDKMRDRASDLAPQVTHEFWQDDARFFHVGGSGQWRAFFDDAAQERYDKRLDEIADRDLVAWLNGA